MENGNGEAAEEEEEEKAFWWLGERNDAVVVRRRRGISARVSVLTIAAPSGGSNRRLPNRPTLPLILPSFSVSSISLCFSVWFAVPQNPTATALFPRPKRHRLMYSSFPLHYFYSSSFFFFLTMTRPSFLSHRNKLILLQTDQKYK